MKHHVATSIEEARVSAEVAAFVVRVALAHYPDPLTAMRAVGKVAAFVAQFQGKVGPSKMVREGQGWRLRPMMPAFPSKAFEQWALRHLESEVPTGEIRPMLSAAQFAVTNRCPMHCQHCSAERELAKRDRMDLASLQGFVHSLQRARVSQIVLTGGEPMVRLADVLTLIREAGPESEFWMNTSGLGLDDRAAEQLAEAGLTGVWLSLDSERAEEHDAMRGWPGAFDQVQAAASSAQRAGLVVGVSMVATRELIDRAGLDAYAELATRMGAVAIRVITPKAVGRWRGADVGLSDDQVRALAEWTDAMNGGPLKHERPFVLCDEVVSRRIGCKQAGELSVYIDSFGEVHGCPFCLRTGGSLVDGTLDEALANLRRSGCSRFASPMVGVTRPGVRP